MLRVATVLICMLIWAPVLAQTPAAPAPATTGSGKPYNFRDITGYLFPAIAETTGDMQNVAYAMQLRDYCSDKRVPDQFVRDQLARFGRITGRTEDCQTLLDYQKPPVWPPDPERHQTAQTN